METEIEMNKNKSIIDFNYINQTEYNAYWGCCGEIDPDIEMYLEPIDYNKLQEIDCATLDKYGNNLLFLTLSCNLKDKIDILFDKYDYYNLTRRTIKNCSSNQTNLDSNKVNNIRIIKNYVHNSGRCDINTCIIENAKKYNIIDKLLYKNDYLSRQKLSLIRSYIIKYKLYNLNNIDNYNFIIDINVFFDLYSNDTKYNESITKSDIKNTIKNYVILLLELYGKDNKNFITDITRIFKYFNNYPEIIDCSLNLICQRDDKIKIINQLFNLKERLSEDINNTLCEIQYSGIKACNQT